jgi:hypothetical protein
MPIRQIVHNIRLSLAVVFATMSNVTQTSMCFCLEYGVLYLSVGDSRMTFHLLK